jgi:hypothetical protein
VKRFLCMAALAALCLMTSSCAFLTGATRGPRSSDLSIPEELLDKGNCPKDLEDATNGSEKEIQRVTKSHQRQYHKCRRYDHALIDTLLDQGVKPVKGK